MTLFDWLFMPSESMCDRIGHNFRWEPHWQCYLCSTCGLTIRKPGDEKRGHE